jgi:isoquinoline 1-oxidoreductase
MQKEDQTLSASNRKESLFNERVSRRNFFTLMGGGVAVAFTTYDLFGASLLDDVLADDSLAAWIHVQENGKITVFTGKVEVGQNIRTSLSQVVAEELRVPISAIEMIMGDTSLTPYDRGTYGSLTTPTMSPKLRKAAASLREVLIEMAAQSSKTAVALLKAHDGKVILPDGKSIAYATLTKGQKVLKPLNEKASLTPPDQWKIAGTSVPKIHGRSFITGKHKYTFDHTLPGMLYGKILRPPSYGASLVSVDTSKAKAMARITVVEEKDFIGVVGPDSSSAENALWEISAQWKEISQPSRENIFNYLKEKSDSPKGESNKGNAGKVFADAKDGIAQTFLVEYIAHVPLEPRAALANWEGEKLIVWTGTQRPFGVQEQLSELFSIPKENVRVIMPDTGSGYGGKHTGDAALEAARLSKAVAKPVKVNWTREEEFRWAYFRPAGVIEMKSVVNDEGIVTAWEHHNYNSGGAGLRNPYEVANEKIEFHPVESPLRQGSYRALAATANVFARECQMNDMAGLRKMDPVAFRLKNMKDQRLKDVLNATAKAFGWGNARVNGHGYGIACAYEKGGYIATAVEVHMENDGLKIDRVVASYECGKIINPRHLRSQVSGSLVQGLGGALFEAIDFKDGKIINGSLSNYRVPRFSDLPQIEIILVDRPDIESTGAGEAALVALAPAIRQAIFEATGKKLNSLPMIPDGLKS